MMTTTTLKGELALLKVLLRAVEKNVMMSRPVTDNCRYDLIMDLDGKLSRVQVKYAGAGSLRKHVQGSFMVQTASVGHNQRKKRYTANEVDFIAAYSPLTDRVYLLPSCLWEGKSCLSLRYERPKNNVAHYVDAKLWEW